MKARNIFILLTLASYITACSNENGSKVEHDHPHSDSASADKNHGHEHDEEDHGHEHDEEDHEHDKASLGSHDIAGIKVEAAQGHGSVEAGKEGHLVVKLPHKDNGATTVRAWIGTDDRTLSSVGKGEYGPSHDNYDIHAVAPEPLPSNSSWWVEIEKPDGIKAIGSIPLLKDIK